ncbi:MAG TPA: serine/threonine-protein kinase, partial [Gemmataceae bacterium]|nr:serine/threonine-protein kinase [Gemmataceae bacterium]
MSSRSPANSNPPQRIGPYEILRRVGAGGMGTVYKARHVELGRIVALKVLPPDLADKQEMLDRFRLEAKNAARLRHEHIVTLYEIGEANGVRYLAMEYVKGKNLHEIIHAKVRLEPEESRKLMMQAARALDQAYREGIVHRDIKPANFLLTVKDGKPFVKLTDFGLARCLEDTDFKVTRSGTTVGTVDYIAPEQARNSRQADIRSDIYSLGCTLYHMLAGQPPFPEGDMTERLLKHVEATPDDVRKFNPQVPPGIVVVLNKMLAKRPQDRYQTPQELLNDLEHLPSGPILSPRELLEALALDSVAKHKRGTATETTRLLGQEKLLPGEIPTLRYRYSRLFVRKPKNRGSEGGGSALPIVIHGWKAWSVIACVAAALLGVGTFLAMNWGNNREQRQTPEWVDNAPGSAREDDHPKSRDGSVQNDSKLNDSDRVVSSLPPSRKTEADESQGRIDPSVKAQRQRPKSWQPAVYQPPPEQLASLEKQFQAIVRPDTPVVLPGNSGVAKTEPADAQKASGSSTSTAASSRPEKPALIVSRLPFGSDGRHFDSLAAACAAAGAARAVVEIHENGPLFASPVSLGDVNLLVRAGKGYRPLLVWDIQDSTAPRSSRWFSIAGGSVSLQNLEVVVKVSDLSQDEHLSLFGTPRGEIRAENCTFSVAGRHRAGTSVIQIDPPSTAVPPGRCRLANCFIRGADVTVLDLRAAGAEATLDGCVLISSNRPLVEVIGKAGAANSIIRAVHCTLVSGQSLFRVLPASAMDRE